MRTILFISFFVILAIFIGCEQQTTPDEDTQLEHTAEGLINIVSRGDVEVIIIDGCEYLIYKEEHGSNQGYGFMSHKGNCKNPIHIYNEASSSKSLAGAAK